MKRKLNLYIIVLTIILSGFIQVFNTHYQNMFYGDAMGYYTYLPATFISKQLKEPAEIPSSEKLSETRIQIRDYLKNIFTTPSGNYLNQYTYGVALFEMPFFLAAHTFEIVTNEPATGFSSSYKFAIRLSSIFYAVLGLYILFLCLQRYFDSTNALLGLSVLVIGTNFLWFAVVQGGMAHIIIFFLVACLIYLSIKIHDKPSWKLFVLLGLTLGMIVLIRPTDLLFASIPILYGIDSWSGLKSKFNFIWQHRLKIIVALLVMIIPMIPQMLYWKISTGHYLFYSYGEQRFHWRHPHIKDGLFSYKNGWLIYTPLMILSFAGLIFVRNLKSIFLIIVLTLPVYIYVVYAWYCYNYINGLGSRPMIHFYPLLVFPIVALIQYVANKKMVVKISFGMLVLFLCSISYSYSIQQIRGTLWSENSTKKFNLTTLFRYKLNYNDLICFDNEIVQPDARNLVLIKNLQTEHFENDTSKYVLYDSLRNSFVYHIESGVEYPDRILQAKYNKKLHEKSKWIKCSGQFYAPKYCEVYKNNMIVLEVKRGDEMISWQSCIINNKIGLGTMQVPPYGFTLFENRIKQWGSVFFFAPVPENIQDGDQIRMIIWGIDRRELLMDDLKLELYQ